MMEKLKKTYFNHSSIETLRFKQQIYRAQVADKNFDMVYDAFRAVEENSVMVLRFPTDQLRSFNSSGLAALNSIFADCLVYYRADLSSLLVNELRNEINFSVWNQSVLPQIDTVTGTIFKDYKNHYFSNPHLSPELIQQGYSEWMRGYAKESSADEKTGWFGMIKGEISGFATCEINSGENCGEGILYGVMPHFEGKGIYTDLIRFTQKYLKSKNIKEFYVSTQVQNYAVQKCWVKEHFKLDASFFTYHIYNRTSSPVNK